MIIECTFKHVGHLFFKVVELEGRQEAEAAKMKGHNRRHRLLELQINQPRPDKIRKYKIYNQIVHLLCFDDDLIIDF